MTSFYTPQVLRNLFRFLLPIFIFLSIDLSATSAQSATVVIQEGTNGVTGTEAAAFSTFDSDYEDASQLYFRYDFPNVLYFPLTGSIPAGSIISSATLDVNITEEYNASTTHIQCGYITDADHTGVWHDRGSGTEGSGLGATMGRKDASNSIYWNNAENAFTSVMSAMACGQTDIQTTGWKSWDVTTVVQSWLNNTYANRGFWLREASGANSNARGAAKYHTTTSLRPKLTVTYTPPANPPGAPTLNIPTAAGSQSVGLSWNSISTADGYKIRYGTSSGNYPNTIDVGNGTQYSVTGLTNGTTYYFVVAAYNYAGDGTDSSAQSATAHYAPATGTVTLQEGTNSVTGTEAAYVSPSDVNYEDTTLIYFRFNYPNIFYFPVASHVPSGATIHSALLETFVYEEYNTGMANIACGYITDPNNTGAWHDRGSGSLGYHLGATFAKKDGASSVYWDSAQNPLTSVMSATACGQTNVQTTGWKSWDATTVVQGWSNGTYANRGFWLQEESGADSNARAAGKYHATTSWHPKLTVTYTPATLPPASAPVVNTPTSGSQTVDLSWNSISDADGYKIKYGQSTGSYTTTLDAGNPTAYSVTGLTNGVTYYFVVVPYNLAGDGLASNEVSVAPQSAAPGAPTLSSVTPGDQSAVMTWGSVSGATGYKIKYGTSTGSYGSPVDVGNVTSYEVTGLTNATTYYFVVSAYHAGGDGAISNEMSATPQSSAPSAPTLSGVVAGDHAATASWSSVSGATSYHVKYGTSSGTYTQTIDAGNVASYQVINLTNTTAYYFVVTAVNADEESVVSNEISATPQASNLSYGNDQTIGGTSSASSCHLGCASAFSHSKAFDDVINVPDGWVSAGSQSGWLEYQFTSAKTIGKYTINPRQKSGGSPKDWTFEGFDSSTSQWVILDTRTNQTSATWTYQTTREFTFDNSTAYTRYRINISANGGHSDVGMTEMEMMELSGTGAPSAISDLAAQEGNGQVVLTWSAPPSNGSPITGYQVQYGTVASSSFDTLVMDDATPGITITGLTNFETYQFRVIAINANGTSNVSNTTTATPLTGTLVSGSITANTTWTAIESPYIVTGDITVNSGVTLTIEADVQVLFFGNYSFTLDGILNAQGSSGHHVVFSSTKLSPVKGDWKHIKVNNYANTLKFLTVQYADRGIYVPSAVTGTKNPIITDNLIAFNNDGIYFEPSTAPIISKNTITDNSRGINAFCNIFTACASQISYNTIAANSSYNFFVQGDNASLIIKAENNWWGTTNTATIDASIFDHADDATEATVDYIPYLNDSPENATFEVSANSVTSRFIDPRRGQQAEIHYTLAEAADVTIKIYNKNTQALVRTLLSNTARASGSHSEIWNGRDDSAQFLPEAVYVYTLEAQTSGGNTGVYPLYTYSPVVVFSNVTITPTTTFEPLKGQRLQVTYDLSSPGIVSMGLGNTVLYVNAKPRNVTGNVDYWDGRDVSGNIIEGWSSFPVQAKLDPMPENSIVIQNVHTLDISMLISDPYIIRPVYNEQTQITYSLTESATVTVKILNAGGNTVIRVLEAGVSKTSGNYTVVWDGRNTDGEIIATNGDYRVRVEAVDSFGDTITRDGNIRVWF